MRQTLVVFVLAFVPHLICGQSNELTSEVFDLINQSRTNPKQFLADYEAEIKKYEPKYISILKNAKPIPAAIWDEGLEAMARSVVDNGSLNPIYKGENKLCGKSSGSRSGTSVRTPLEYVCWFYTNINIKQYKYIGLHYNKRRNNGYSYYWGKSCEREKVEFSFTEKIDSSGVDLKSLNTAAKVDYMTPAEKRMVFEINFVRKYPKVYAQIIAKHLSDDSNSTWGLEYGEYFAGLELIEELNTMEPLNTLTPKKCVFEAAKLHGLDSQERGFFSHTGSDKSQPRGRILDQCADLKSGSENGCGGSRSPRESVISLLIDDGISSRGHRYNIINKKWTYVGCFQYDDVKYGYYWVQNFGY
ncbi:MAG: CAP domain-containing protein [Bacteroidota bacterium]